MYDVLCRCLKIFYVDAQQRQILVVTGDHNTVDE